MIQTKKIANGNVAVSFYPTAIMVRKSGKCNFGKEKELVRIDGDKLVINKSVAEEFQIEICVEE